MISWAEDMERNNEIPAGTLNEAKKEATQKSREPIKYTQVMANALLQGADIYIDRFFPKRLPPSQKQPDISERPLLVMLTDGEPKQNLGGKEPP